MFVGTELYLPKETMIRKDAAHESERSSFASSAPAPVGPLSREKGPHYLLYFFI